MFEPNFQLYVLANGYAGLYRTLLSVWKLDTLPKILTILYKTGTLETVKKSIYTVCEDTSESGPTIHLIERRFDLKSYVLDEQFNLNSGTLGFLAERDMLMPSYADIVNEKVIVSRIQGIPYHQRTRFGSSKLKFPKVDLINPISSILLERNYVLEFLEKAKFTGKNEFIYPDCIDINLEVSNGRVIVQSNIRSPFDLSF